jgi:hypothetical protein
MRPCCSLNIERHASGQHLLKIIGDTSSRDDRAESGAGAPNRTRNLCDSGEAVQPLQSDFHDLAM